MRPGLLVAAMVLVALNLRATLACLPPLVATIQADLGLGGLAAGLLTALPVLCMGLFAPGAHRLAHLVGREAAVALAVASLLVGLLLRLGGAAPVLLYGGTLLVGVGIAICGVVLPGIVKEFFPDRPGLVTGIYMFAMMLGATAASALAVPLASLLGSWQRSLGVWALPAAVGLAAWLPVVRRVNDHDEPATDPAPAGRLPWRSSTAWTVATYMAMQSWLFYSELAWIAPFYVARGRSAQEAGLLLGSFALTQLVSGLGAPALADRTRDRRPLLFAVIGACVLGLLGLLVLPDAAAWAWVLLLGLGQGGSFALGLVLLVDYAPDPAGSARLSAMVFLVGYCVAAAGPATFGLLRDVTGGFTVPLAVLVAIGAALLLLLPRLRPGGHVD